MNQAAALSTYIEAAALIRIVFAFEYIINMKFGFVISKPLFRAFCIKRRKLFISFGKRHNVIRIQSLVLRPFYRYVRLTGLCSKALSQSSSVL